MLEQMGAAAKAASYKLALLSSREKNRVLEKIADYLESQSQEILLANEQDLLEARRNGLSEAMLDRLALTPARLKGIADDVRQVCNLADPVGQVIDGGLLDSGLRLERRRVPLGVIGVIYEARPNVTVDVASPALDRDRAGAGVLDDVVQPFLTDAEQRHALAFAQRRFANAPVEMADNAAAFQLHLAHQGAYRLLQRQVVKLARPQPAEQASHRVIHTQ